jgi:hypothetical protein
MRPFFISIWRCDKAGNAKTPPMNLSFVGISVVLSAGTHMVLSSRTKEVYAAFTPDATMEI